MIRNIRGFILVGTILLFPNPPSAQDDAYFLLTGEQLECLAQNASQYLTAPDETLFVRPGDCGTEQTGQTLSIMEMTLNTAPDIELVDDQNAPDEIVVFTREDFTCLAQQPIPTIASLVAFYPDGCRLEVRTP